MPWALTVAPDWTWMPTALDVVPTYRSPPFVAKAAAATPDNTKLDDEMVVATYTFQVAAFSLASKVRAERVTELKLKFEEPVAERIVLPVTNTVRLAVSCMTMFWVPVIAPPSIEIEFDAPASDVEKRKFVEPAEIMLPPTIVNFRFVTACTTCSVTPDVLKLHPLKLNRCVVGTAAARYIWDEDPPTMADDVPRMLKDVGAPASEMA